MKSLMDYKLVHKGRQWTIIKCPGTTKSSYNGRTNAQHLGNFRLFVAITKPVAIAMNPSNELTSVSGYNFSSRWWSYLRTHWLPQILGRLRSKIRHVKKIAWLRTKQEFSRENGRGKGRGKMRGWPMKDRLWGSSWWRRGLFRWPRLWWDDRYRAMKGTGGKHRSDPIAAISIQLGLGFGLGLVRDEAWLLSMPVASIGAQWHGSEHNNIVDWKMTCCWELKVSVKRELG